jgi:hypothetical protein
LNRNDAISALEQSDMKLYERDYTQITADEEAAWKALQQQETISQNGRFSITQSLFRQYPKAVRHFISLFPINYLDAVELENEQCLKEQADAFARLLDTPDVKERELLKFIGDRKAYFLIASLLKEYFTFGHHDAYLFREFPLGVSHIADFLLVGKSSDGWHFVFVELESPAQNITTATGDLGESFRKGINQTGQWEHWLEANYSSLAEIFGRYKQVDTLLPDEFHRLDTSRLNFVVVAGRRSNFKDATYRQRRENHKKGEPLILHYDNLLDAAKNIIGKLTY